MERILLIARCFVFLTAGMLQIGQAEDLGMPQKFAQRVLAHRDYIVTIQGDFDSDKVVTWLDRRQLRIGTDDNVTWINESKAEVKIRFGKGSQCRQVTSKALGWSLQPEKCYETKDTLKFKQSMTIRFREVGLYHYEVEFVGKDRSEQGSIQVQTEER